MSDQWREAVESWDPEAPPPGFAERVVAQARAERQPQPRSRPRSRRGWIALAAAAALILAAIYGPEWPDRGRQVGPGPVALSEGVQAEADAGAALSWSVALGGATTVQQHAGRVFYRVTPGTDLAVTTPGGRVTALGTCLTVEVIPMDRAHPLKKPIVAALGGAAISAAVLVTVYEGRVAADTEAGAVEATPGQSVILAPGQAPTPARLEVTAQATAQIERLEAEKRALTAQVSSLEVALKAARRPAPADPNKAAALVEQIEVLQQALDEEQALRQDQEGEPQAFPAELPEAYQEAGLRASFEAMLAELPVEAEITEIDCSEYPCIVYGQATDLSERREQIEAATEQLQAAVQAEYPKEEANHSVSIWGTSVETEAGVTQQDHFSIAPYPKGDQDEAAHEALRLRLRHRKQQHQRDWMKAQRR